jgi:hypothetical protein
MVRTKKKGNSVYCPFNSGNVKGVQVRLGQSMSLNPFSTVYIKSAKSPCIIEQGDCCLATGLPHATLAFLGFLYSLYILE